MPRALPSLLTALALLPATGCGDDPRPARTPESNKVGYVETEFMDGERQRRLETIIWYPAADTAQERRHAYRHFALAYSAPNAAYLGGQKPLILLSHGDKGSNVDQSWLAEALAANGYIVASVAHWRNTYYDNVPEETVMMWNRPADLRLVLTRLLDDPAWGPRIDSTRIAAAGHSSGGYTALALLGVVFKSRQMYDYCQSEARGPDCGLAHGADRARVDLSGDARSYRDARIKAAFAMAPAVGQGIEIQSLKNISDPVHIVFAKNDDLTLPELNAEVYAWHIPSAQITRLEQGGHFVYMPICTKAAWLMTYFHRFDICGRRAFVDRRQMHARIVEQALAFFNQALGISP